MSEKGCEKWHFLVLNKVRTCRTGQHTPTNLCRFLLTGFYCKIIVDFDAWLYNEHDSETECFKNSLFFVRTGTIQYFIALIDLFHNGGLLMYSFKYMIISLSDLVWKKVFLCIFHMLTRLERPIIILIKEYINRPPLWKRSILFNNIQFEFSLTNDETIFTLILLQTILVLKTGHL